MALFEKETEGRKDVMMKGREELTQFVGLQLSYVMLIMCGNILHQCKKNCFK